ncbi:hypothetical protein AKJ16_DCAP13281 [Drosera capensis]
MTPRRQCIFNSNWASLLLVYEKATRIRHLFSFIQLLHLTPIALKLCVHDFVLPLHASSNPIRPTNLQKDLQQTHDTVGIQEAIENLRPAVLRHAAQGSKPLRSQSIDYNLYPPSLFVKAEDDSKQMILGMLLL